MHGKLRTTRQRSAVIALVLAIGALTMSPPASAGTQARAVTLGVIAPIDGGVTSFGRGIRNSVQLAVDEANERHTIPGWTIKLRILDDSSDPAKGKTAAAALARDKGVVAVVGPYNSGVAQEAAPVLAKRSIALVSPSNTLTSLTRGDDPDDPQRRWKSYFRLVAPDSLQGEFLARQARSLGFANAAVVSETKVVSKQQADRFVAAFEKGGGKVSVQRTVPDGADDFSDFLAAAAPAAPDLVFVGAPYGVAARLRQAATAAGITSPLMGGDEMKDPTYIEGAGTAAEGSYASTVGAPIATLPGGDAFLAAYDGRGFTEPPTDYGPYAYDATKAIITALPPVLRGMEAIPSSARARVVSRLRRTNGTGVTGKVAFDTYGDTRAPLFTLYRVTGTPLAWTPAS